MLANFKLSVAARKQLIAILTALLLWVITKYKIDSDLADILTKIWYFIIPALIGTTAVTDVVNLAIGNTTNKTTPDGNPPE